MYIGSRRETQSTGIRQGCTLSPYLFLIIMSMLFEDVMEDTELRLLLRTNRPENHEQDEVLYADDTIIFSTDPDTTEKLLHKIQECAAYYGLYPNESKCESLNTDQTTRNRIKFKNKNAQPNTQERKVGRQEGHKEGRKEGRKE